MVVNTSSCFAVQNITSSASVQGHLKTLECCTTILNVYHSKTWWEVNVVYLILLLNLDSACIVFVDFHNCMEMKNFIFGYCNYNQCQSNSF